jgi:hypothetical protein
MIRGGELVEWSAFDHRDAPNVTSFRTQRYGQRHKLEIEIIEINRFWI